MERYVCVMYALTGPPPHANIRCRRLRSHFAMNAENCTCGGAYTCMGVYAPVVCVLVFGTPQHNIFFARYPSAVPHTIPTHYTCTRYAPMKPAICFNGRFQNQTIIHSFFIWHLPTMFCSQFSVKFHTTRHFFPLLKMLHPLILTWLIHLKTSAFESHFILSMLKQVLVHATKKI